MRMNIDRKITRSALIAAATCCVLAMAGASRAAESVAVFVTVEADDPSAFVDPETEEARKERADSAEDLTKRLRKKKAIKLVASPEEAAVVITVIGRGLVDQELLLLAQVLDALVLAQVLDALAASHASHISQPDRPPFAGPPDAGRDATARCCHPRAQARHQPHNILTQHKLW
jgi:hypothetical protein